MTLKLNGTTLKLHLLMQAITQDTGLQCGTNDFQMVTGGSHAQQLIAQAILVMALTA